MVRVSFLATSFYLVLASKRTLRQTFAPLCFSGCSGFLKPSTRPTSMFFIFCHRLFGQIQHSKLETTHAIAAPTGKTLVHAHLRKLPAKGAA